MVGCRGTRCACTDYYNLVHCFWFVRVGAVVAVGVRHIIIPTRSGCCHFLAATSFVVIGVVICACHRRGADYFEHLISSPFVGSSLCVKARTTRRICTPLLIDWGFVEGFGGTSEDRPTTSIDINATGVFVYTGVGEGAVVPQDVVRVRSQSKHSCPNINYKRLSLTKVYMKLVRRHSTVAQR